MKRTHATSFGFAFALMQAFTSAAHAGFEYICIQPDDSVYTTVPMINIPSSIGALNSEYAGNLFKLVPEASGNGITTLSFRPIPELELRLKLEDYENEVIFDRVRFLVADGKLYTWIGFTATRRAGVMHRVVRSIFVNNDEIVRSRPITIDVRKDLYNCNS